MRKLLGALIAVSLLALVPSPSLKAARAPEREASRLELLVVEVAGCTVCELVRLHIQPAYEASPRAREVPMRYIDITNVDETTIGLATHVATVPTIVLMRDGREVDRISGYTGPKQFFLALTELMEQAAE